MAKTGMPRLGDGRGGVVLGREDVAGRPADIGAEMRQGLDQYRGLDRHVQRAGDARALERLGRAILLAQCHQARHLGFGDVDFLAAEIGSTGAAMRQCRTMKPVIKPTTYTCAMTAAHRYRRNDRMSLPKTMKTGR
jgi:hypothetical protein